MTREEKLISIATIVRSADDLFAAIKKEVQSQVVTNPDRCILNLDSPSYPPEDNEYLQCASQGCKQCKKYILKRLADAYSFELYTMKLEAALKAAEQQNAISRPYMELVDKLTDVIVQRLGQRPRTDGPSESTSPAPHNRRSEHSESNDQ